MADLIKKISVNYRVERKITHGKSGCQTYLIVNRGTGRRCILKYRLLKFKPSFDFWRSSSDFGINTSNLDCLSREILIIGDLNNKLAQPVSFFPQILELGYVNTNGKVCSYFICDCLNGLTLLETFQKNEIDGKPVFSGQNVYCEFFTELTDMYMEMHIANRFVHNDIKPDNIFVCTGAEKPKPKFIDFGLANTGHIRGTHQSPIKKWFSTTSISMSLNMGLIDTRCATMRILKGLCRIHTIIQQSNISNIPKAHGDARKLLLMFNIGLIKIFGHPLSRLPSFPPVNTDASFLEVLQTLMKLFGGHPRCRRCSGRMQCSGSMPCPRHRRCPQPPDHIFRRTTTLP